jgi:hypothetical protein
MVTTRNRSRSGQVAAPSPELVELPVRTRRTRLTKANTNAADDTEADSVEQSGSSENSMASTPSAEYMTPPQETQDETETPMIDERESKDTSEGEGEDEGEIERKTDDDSEDDQDLDELLFKAQVSLKRKAVSSADKKKEPLYNFPKLETGLDTNNLYIKQDNKRAKVDVNTVVVVEKGTKNPKPSSGPALETCEISMNAEQVHVSKKQRKEVSYDLLSSTSCGLVDGDTCQKNGHS